MWSIVTARVWIAARGQLRHDSGTSLSISIDLIGEGMTRGGRRMSRYVLDLQDIGQTDMVVAGGKGASLRELSRIDGIHVPDGFCISTEAYTRVIGEVPSMHDLLDQLALLRVEDRNAIVELSREIRRVIEGIAIPEDITEEITRHLSRHGDSDAYAVRSSATAEDLPTASFAGQQDTYLNVSGTEAILRHIRKCWASLFTERATMYRLHSGFDHRNVYLAVVVQRMVFPEVAGVMFTADPVTSHRRVVSIDASFGLGESVVSGLVNADNYKVRDGRIIEKKLFTKRLALYAARDGGTIDQEIEPERQSSQALSDEQIVELERIGRAIEAHFGCPQDIEWCVADDTFYVVQSRPITTLFPIPEAPDREDHVYVSVGHQQMMTDPMKPLGLSLWQLTAARPMHKAGGRLFVEVAQDLASPAGREFLVNVLGKSDPLIKDALTTILERGDFITSSPHAEPEASPGKSNTGMAYQNYQAQLDNDPAIVSDLMKNSQALIETLKHEIRAKSGVDLIDFILEDFQNWRKGLSDPQSFGAIITGINAASWINETMMEWLDEKNVADTLAQSAPNNITSEMGLALLDVADAIRPYPDIVRYLQHVEDDSFLDELDQFDGGKEARTAIDGFLARYGMRCVGEIDITRPRWSEKPTTLVPIILSNIRNFEPGASTRKFEHGRQEALKKEREVLDRLKHLPDGVQKVAATKHQISLLRNFIGYREYPKYSMINRYFVYKQALLREAERLAEANVLHDREDIYYLTFEELHDVVRTNQLDDQIILKRKDEYRFYEKLTPPRVLTSDGEVVTGRYRREYLPPGALAGLPVSSGVIEGRARVILNLEDADLQEGDILVTAFTDPSWTPVFVSITGLVTEVGGLMSHGSVIAREYGLPAVVGVERATRLIPDGQRIRVHGTEGYVEIL
jgi:rifampicin phosphotransferase